MNAMQTCPECGTKLDAGAPEGLCPTCMMKAGLPTNADTVFAPLSSDPLAPTEIAKHFPQLEILAELGRGGMGVVYKARQKQLDRIVALKVLPPDAARDPNFAERFLREARALAKLNHPNIVAVYEFGENSGLFFLIMEFVDGANLRQLQHTHRLTPAEALAIIPKICDALQYAHEEGVVHRDIKPENILVDKRGRVKIADFGLAKLLGQTAADARLTRSNLQMGTPHYMAPEQMEKPLSVDHRADIYSLGVVFYELLTGELPLGRFGPPSSCVRGMQIDVRLDEVVLHALEKDPERRYQHVSEVKTDVEHITQSGPPPASCKQPLRRKLLVATAATAALLLVVGLFAFGNRFFGKSSPAVTAAATPESHFNYTTNNGTITITKYTGPGGDVTIPSTINGMPVTSIGDWALHECAKLTSVTIPNGVTSIGDNAFRNCASLASVTISKSVTAVGINPFIGCSGLISISVDAANSAYSSSADGVLFNKEKTCLVSCAGGKAGSYTIPDGVNVIGAGAFQDHSGLTSITIPNSVKSIADVSFQCCVSLTNVTIGNSVTNIGKWAFFGCPSLTNVTIPNSVTTIDSRAFGGCFNLTAVYFQGDAPRLDKDVFEGSNKVKIYYLPSAKGWGKEFGGRPTAPWNPQATAADSPAAMAPTPFTCTTNNGALTITKYTGPGGAVAIPSTINGLPVASIGNSAFSGCNGLTSATIPNGVTAIAADAFNGCSGLTNVTIPNSVINIGARAFQRCANLTNVMISNGVASVGDCAFQWCNSLASVTISGSVTSIGINPFAGCVGLRSIFVDAANPAYCSSSDGVVFNKEKTCLVSYPAGKTGDYVIHQGVTRIGELAFDGCHNLASVIIPNSVTSIGGEAFSYCSNLTRMEIPASVNSIVRNPFPGCSRLTSIVVDAANPACVIADGVLFDKQKTRLISYSACASRSYTIPDSVSSIGFCAFKLCSNLASVIIPNSVTNVGWDAFHGCGGLTNVTIPRSITSIGAGMFVACKKLTNIAISNNITSIEYCAFLDCSGLTNVTIPSSVTSIGGFAFSGCSALPKLTIPNGVTSIKDNVFQLCTNLTSVTLPHSVTSIGVGAFAGCSALPHMTIPLNVTSIGSFAFSGCGRLASVYFEGNAPGGGSDGSVFRDSVKATVYYQSGTKGWGKEFGGRPTAPWNPQAMNANPPAATSPPPFNCTTNNGTITITKYTGPGGDVTIPSMINGLPVTSIGDYAFKSRGDVTSVTIPNSVTEIRMEAFGWCASLTNVVIPNSVTSLGPNPFVGCSRLTMIEVDAANPAYSRSADGVLFDKGKTCLVSYSACKAGSYVIPSTVSSIGSGAFKNCTNLTRITIPNSVTSIGDDVFECCSGLTSITIPNGITSIGRGTFNNCSSLTNVTIPSSVTSIGYAAFYVCSNLTNVTIPSSVTNIGDWAFACCSALPIVTIPKGVTSIGNWAFGSCVNLTKVTIPDGVTTLGSRAFENCANLTAVYFKGDAPRLGKDGFKDSNKATIYYPSGTKGWGQEFGGRPTAPWNPQGK